MTQTAPVLIQPTLVNHSRQGASSPRTIKPPKRLSGYCFWVGRVVSFYVWWPNCQPCPTITQLLVALFTLPLFLGLGLAGSDVKIHLISHPVLTPSWTLTRHLKLLHEPRGKGWITPHLVHVCTSGVFFGKLSCWFQYCGRRMKSSFISTWQR